MRMNYEDPPPGALRRHAGNYLETELLVALIGPLPTAFAGAGALIAATLAAWVSLLSAVVVGVTCLFGSLLLWILNSRRRDNLKKGHVAERQIGRALEEAITADNCAVAHNVEGISNTGDIDHIVATPQRVWVVETKYRRVPKASFSRVLKRIGANMAKVRELLPPDTPVSGCLVLAYERDGVAPKRDDIFVYNQDSFGDQFLTKLGREKGDECVVDKQVSSAIWRLSRGEVVEKEDADTPGHDTSGSSKAPAKAKPSSTDEMRRRSPKAYERWSAEDDQELRRLHETGWSRTELSEHFGRQPSAIRSRLAKLGYD